MLEYGADMSKAEESDDALVANETSTSSPTNETSSSGEALSNNASSSNDTQPSNASSNSNSTNSTSNSTSSSSNTTSQTPAQKPKKGYNWPLQEEEAKKLRAQEEVERLKELAQRKRSNSTWTQRNKTVSVQKVNHLPVILKMNKVSRSGLVQIGFN